MENPERRRWAYLLIVLAVFLSVQAPVLASPSIRKAHGAGTFYPGQPEELGKMIDDFLARVPERESLKGEIVALIVPHAGYIYSGQVAAHAYKLIAGQKFSTVILIGPYHQDFFSGASVWSSGSWVTPLGRVSVNSVLAKAILKASNLFRFDPKAHLTEHSLEVQIPFLQRVLKNFTLVPIAVTDPLAENRRLLARAILDNTRGRRVLVIASTDMSHYHSDPVAKQMDQLTLNLFVKKDAAALSNELFREKSELCGSAAALTVLEMAELMGNTKLEILKYANSGDVTGERDRVVGYGAAVLYKDEPPEAKGLALLNPEQERELLRIARQSIDTFVKEGRMLEILVNDHALEEPRAVFVTLRQEGALRGCIGGTLATQPLYLAVRDMAIEAAVHDFRFKPVEPEEIADLTIEIAVLSPPQRVRSADEIELGKHGVMVRSGERVGIFLPKVAQDTEWTKEEFLGELCSQKAGLPRKAWKDPSTELYTFTTHDFSEIEKFKWIRSARND